MKKKQKKIEKRICVVCGCEFIVGYNKNGRKSKSKTCSKQCRHILYVNIGKENFIKVKNSGRFVGWKSRNITSYAEKFWEGVLTNNNIAYKREKRILKYFLDFYLEKNGIYIDLEIDGKQHKYEERMLHDKKRDEDLRKHGIVIYRIEWNKISTDEGKKLMKTKIEQFLSFYDKIQ